MEKRRSEIPVFTPLLNGVRMHYENVPIVIQPGCARGPGYHGRVAIEGLLYDVYGVPCSLPGCYCDAEIRLADGAVGLPRTGLACACRPGVERDNCSLCEGSGREIDWRTYHAMKRAK